MRYPVFDANMRLVGSLPVDPRLLLEGGSLYVPLRVEFQEKRYVGESTELQYERIALKPLSIHRVGMDGQKRSTWVLFSDHGRDDVARIDNLVPCE